MKTLFTKHIKRISLIAIGVLGILVLLYILSVWFSTKPSPAEQIEFFKSQAGLIDPVQQNLVQVDIPGNVDQTLVSYMPEIVVGLPKGDWFSDTALRSLAKALGFSSKSTVQSFSDQLYWQEGSRSLSIDSRTGTITFSTAFNVGGETVRIGMPTEETTKNALLSLLARMNVPTEFYNIGSARYEFMRVDESGLMLVDTATSGGFIRMSIPYTILGYEALLPFETAIVADAQGKIVYLSLLLLNVTPTGLSDALISQDDALELLTYGGIVVSGGSSFVEEVTVQTIYPAFYLSQGDFYNVSARRRLEPLYIFSDNDAKVGVPIRKL